MIIQYHTISPQGRDIAPSLQPCPLQISTPKNHRVLISGGPSVLECLKHGGFLQRFSWENDLIFFGMSWENDGKMLQLFFGILDDSTNGFRMDLGGPIFFAETHISTGELVSQATLTHRRPPAQVLRDFITWNIAITWGYASSLDTVVTVVTSTMVS